MKGLTVVFSSHKGSEYDLMFENRIKDSCGIEDVQVICIPNEKKYSLTEAYNIAWEKFDESNRNNIIVFLHNDIHFKTPNWGLLLVRKFKQNPTYGIIGLAGSIELATTGVWWNDRSKCFGIVDHTDGIKEWTTIFSPPIKNIQQVVVIDGVFIAVDPQQIEWEFNEDFKGFHLYDIAFCADNFTGGVYIGVTTDIRIMHESIGIVNQEWEDNRLQFVETYKNQLPLFVK